MTQFKQQIILTDSEDVFGNKFCAYRIASETKMDCAAYFKNYKNALDYAQSLSSEYEINFKNKVKNKIDIQVN